MDLNSQLSERQISIYNFICEYLDDHGISPTIDDVKNGCKISSKSVVSYNLDILEKKGFLDRKKGTARSITKFTEHHDLETFNVPVVSTVSAGIPLELLTSDEVTQSEISEDEKISLSKSMFDNIKNLVGLRVRGDSMNGDSIEDGDIIILDCSKNIDYKPRQGDMVIARVDDDTATLKRIYKMGNKVELRPSNKKYSSIIINNNNVIIEGKVVALIRNFIN